MYVSSEFPRAHVTVGVTSQSEIKEVFFPLRKRRCYKLNVVTVTAVAHSTSVRLSTAVAFRCGPAGSIEGAARWRTDNCTSSYETGVFFSCK